MPRRKYKTIRAKRAARRAYLKAHPEEWGRRQKTTHPSVHPNDARGEVYTPITPEILELLERMRMECGGSWRDVAVTAKVRLKVLRRLRRPQSEFESRKTVTLTLLDRLVTMTGVGNVRDYPWFSAEDLIALGVWEPFSVKDLDILEERGGNDPRLRSERRDRKG